MKMNDKLKFTFIAIAIIMFDQWTKSLVLNEIWKHGTIEVTRFFNIVAVWNHGISFGILNNSDTNQWLLITLSALIITTLLFHLKDSVKMERLGYIFIISGAIGNMIDRLNYGAVFDFLDLHINGWHYPSFNVADIFVVLGVMIWIVFYQKDNKVVGLK
jgi:signal peptidase II